MIHQNNNGADNFFATATKEELVDYLVNKIHKEVEKGDGADCDLIRECSDWLDELTKDEVIFTPEELKQNLEKIKANVLSDKPIKKRKKMSVKTFVRIALIAAVIFTISILSLSVVASNQGYDSTWEYLSFSIEKMFGLNIGEGINENAITVIRNSERSQYINIADFLKSESLSILYPHSMPNDNKVERIIFEYKSETNYTLYFIMSNASYILNVSNFYRSDVSLIDTYEVISVGNLNYYYTKKQENLYYAILQFEGFEYTIQAPNYEDLLFIINNMKG